MQDDEYNNESSESGSQMDDGEVEQPQQQQQPPQEIQPPVAVPEENARPKKRRKVAPAKEAQAAVPLELPKKAGDVNWKDAGDVNRQYEAWVAHQVASKVPFHMLPDEDQETFMRLKKAAKEGKKMVVEQLDEWKTQGLIDGGLVDNYKEKQLKGELRPVTENMVMSFAAAGRQYADLKTAPLLAQIETLRGENKKLVDDARTAKSGIQQQQQQSSAHRGQQKSVRSAHQGGQSRGAQPTESGETPVYNLLNIGSRGGVTLQPVVNEHISRHVGFENNKMSYNPSKSVVDKFQYDLGAAFDEICTSNFARNSAATGR